MKPQATIIIVAVIVAAAIVGAAFLLRPHPQPVPMTNEQRCVQNDGTWRTNPSVHFGDYCDVGQYR